MIRHILDNFGTLFANFSCCVFFPSWFCWSYQPAARCFRPWLLSMAPRRWQRRRKALPSHRWDPGLILGNCEKCVWNWSLSSVLKEEVNWKMANDVVVLVVKDSTSNWRWKWRRLGRLVARGRMEILMDGAFLLHHQAWSKLGSESVSWCHGNDRRTRSQLPVP